MHVKDSLWCYSSEVEDLGLAEIQDARAGKEEDGNNLDTSLQE